MYADEFANEFLEAMDMLAPIFAFVIIFYFALLAITLIGYILQGLAINNMSKARGLQNGWFGFIPYLRDWQLGQIAGEIEIGNKKITNTGLWLVLAPIIYGFVIMMGVLIMYVPFLISVISAVEADAPEAMFGAMTYLMVGFWIFVLVLTVAQVFYFLVIYLAYHKIFTQYATGQKPVFYLIIAMFVPLGFPILLFRLSKRPMLTSGGQTPPAGGQALLPEGQMPLAGGYAAPVEGQVPPVGAPIPPAAEYAAPTTEQAI